MDELKTYYVYEYLRANASENGPAGSPYYIGKGKERRAYSSNHRHVPVPKDSDRIRFVAENLNEADAFQLEILLISLHGRLDLNTGMLQNRTDGGDGPSGCVCSEAQKAKMSARMTGEKNHNFGKAQSDATKAKLSLVNTGKKHSPETLAKMSLAQTGKKKSDEHRAKMSLAATGRAHTDETKAKLSLANTGKKLSDEHKAKTSESMKRYCAQKKAA